MPPPPPPPPPLSAVGRWVDYGTFSVPVPPTISDTAGHSITDNRGLFVLHAVLLRTGKVLVFSGHAELAHYATESYVLTVEATAPNHTLERVPFPPDVDLFCCHYVQIFDGRILAVGGSDANFVAHGRSRGAQTICTFDPKTETGTWERKIREYLAQGRWYPTAVILGDGRVLVFSGRRESNASLPSPPGNIADAVEVIHPPDFQPHYVTGGATLRLPLYPGLHLAPNGRIYYTHTNWGLEIDDVDDRSLQMTGATTGTWTPYAGRRPIQPRREEGMSVLLPPASAGKILVVGGSIAETAVPPAPAGTPPHTPTVRFEPPADFFRNVFDGADAVSSELLDTTVTPPTWTETARAMTQGRTNGHLVLLPDKTVLVCGGHDFYKWRATAQRGTTPSLDSEAYLPEKDTFEPRARMNHPRMYHSIALLLPDGRVLAAGGADPNAHEPLLTYPPGWNGPRYELGYPLNRKDFEVFEPPYMHTGRPRPEIDGVQKNGGKAAQVLYGDTFQILTTQAASIRDVAFMRPGAPTHHTDSEQRYVEIPFTPGTNVLNATAPTNRNEAPPGYYMLWIVDTGGLPCTKAEFIQLAEPTLPPSPEEEDGEPWFDCIVATVASGSHISAEVGALRALRDGYLRRSAAGFAFFERLHEAYYGFSPEVVRLIAPHAGLRDLVLRHYVRPLVIALQTIEGYTLGGLRDAELAEDLGRRRVALGAADDEISTGELARALALLDSDAGEVDELSFGERELSAILIAHARPDPYIRWALIDPLFLCLRARSAAEGGLTDEQVGRALALDIDEWAAQLPIEDFWASLTCAEVRTELRFLRDSLLVTPPARRRFGRRLEAAFPESRAVRDALAAEPAFDEENGQ